MNGIYSLSQSGTPRHDNCALNITLTTDYVVKISITNKSCLDDKVYG